MSDTKPTTDPKGALADIQALARVALESDDPVLLVVEDYPYYMQTMLDLAHEHGFKVLLATRGSEALELTR